MRSGCWVASSCARPGSSSPAGPLLVAVLAVAFPPLTKVVESQPLQPLPPKAMAAAEQMAKDFGESAQNVLIVVLTDNRGLQPADEHVYGKLAATLRGETNDVTGVQDFVTTPALRPLLVSSDNKAFYLAVSLRAPAGSPESSQAYQRITEIVKRSTAGTPLTAKMTGQGCHGRRHVDRHRPRHARHRDCHRIVCADHPAGDLPATRDRVAAVDHHRNFGDVGAGRGVRAGSGRTRGVRADDRADDGHDRRRRHRLCRFLDQPLPRVHPVRHRLRPGCTKSTELHRRGHRWVGGHRCRHLPRHGLHPSARVHEYRPGSCGFDWDRVSCRRHAVARHPRARRSTRMGDAATGAHRPPVAAVCRSPGSPTQNASAGQPLGVDRRWPAARSSSSPPSTTACSCRNSTEQRRLFDDAGPLFDEHAAAGVHLRPLTPRPTDIAVPRRPGPDGATRISAAQYRCGARHHAT